eukprot:TRINITY_DN1263_c0_g1_i3.p1 TRINITY_DN1263_c0_g1~~TRINITY_DN1263_c0_g1_i3.p1  ORF type:complete len:140 (-),score=45.93 TRINITY_DN1263_c0_g1_i3:143-499(-)
MAPMKTMKAMKAMKAMRTAKAGMTATAAYQSVAESCDLKSKDVKTIVQSYFDLCAAELKKNGVFNVCQMLKLKLKKKPATPARKGVNPFTKEPCVFKAKPASKAVKALPLRKLKDAVN